MEQLSKKPWAWISGEKRIGTCYCIVCHAHVKDAKVTEGKLCICDFCMKDAELYRKGASISGTKEVSFSLCVAPYRGALRDSFLAYKFRHQQAYGKLFAKLMTEALAEAIREIQPDMITAVPLSEKRKRERGFNQTEEMAVALAESSGILWSDRAVFRIRNTKRQSRLPSALRVANVKGAFLADKTVVSGKRVLLVDDIYTRGATMDACANALHIAGAKEVIGAVLFRTEMREWCFNLLPKRQR